VPADRVVVLVGPGDGVSPPVAGWESAGPRMRMLDALAPGPSHLRIRALQDAGAIAAVISDTDDVLLDEVGVRVDVELRGSIRESVCRACGYTEPLACLLEMLPVPHCAACGAVLAPGTPALPGAQAAAEQLVRGADLLLLAGVAADHPLAALVPGGNVAAA